MVSYREFQETMARVNEEFQRQSRAIVTEAGEQLPALVESGQVLLGIDRGDSRQLLMQLDGNALLAKMDVDLRSEIRLTKFLHLVEVPLLLALVVLSFVAWRWWGLLSIPVALGIFFWGPKSNLTGRGSFSYLLVLGFGTCALFAKTDPVFLWAVVGACLGVVQRARYSIPNRAVRRAALTSPAFLDLAIGANVAILKYPERSCGVAHEKVENV
jgi:hypothetical protein